MHRWPSSSNDSMCVMMAGWCRWLKISASAALGASERPHERRLRDASESWQEQQQQEQEQQQQQQQRRRQPPPSVMPQGAVQTTYMQPQLHAHAHSGGQ